MQSLTYLTHFEVLSRYLYVLQDHVGILRASVFQISSSMQPTWKWSLPRVEESSVYSFADEEISDVIAITLIWRFHMIYPEKCAACFMRSRSGWPASS